MLTKASVQVLQSITAITNSVLIEYPITTIRNESGGVIGTINFSVLDEEFEEFGIFDLSSFLGALDVLDEPVVTLNAGIITAKDTNSSISFVTSSAASLEEFTDDPRKVTSSVDSDSVVDVDIDTDLMSKIRKGTSIFKSLKDIRLVNKDGVFSLSTANITSFSHQENSYSITLEETSKNTNLDFDIAIPINNFLSLPNMNFTMSIKEKQGKFRVVLYNEIFSFVLPLIP